MWHTARNSDRLAEATRASMTTAVRHEGTQLIGFGFQAGQDSIISTQPAPAQGRMVARVVATQGSTDPGTYHIRAWFFKSWLRCVSVNGTNGAHASQRITLEHTE